MLLRAFVLSALGLVAMTPAAAVLVIPAATSEVCFQNGLYEDCYSGSGSVPRSIAWLQGGSAAGGSPFPVASAEARDKWSFRASYRYYFAVDSAGEGAIPLLAYFRLLAASQGEGRASAQIDVQGVTRSLDTATDTALVRYQAVTGVLQSTILGGSVGSVTLQAFTDTSQITDDYGGGAFAFADPFIMIDPAYSAIDPDYATNLTLRFSEGVINAAAPGVVPEPTAWAMLLAGFGGIGGMLRRRRAITLSR